MNEEQIYDEQINPLMAQIIEICKSHKIAMLASFHLPTEEDDGLVCTSALLEDDYRPPKAFLQSLNLIRPPERKPLMVTTRDASGNITRMDAIL